MAKHNNTTKMLQSIIDGQISLKSVVFEKIDKLETKLIKEIRENRVQIKENRKRIDKFGYELTELSNDAPTNEEVDELNEKVKKIYKKLNFM